MKIFLGHFSAELGKKKYSNQQSGMRVYVK